MKSTVFNFIVVLFLLFPQQPKAQTLLPLSDVHPGYLYKLSGRYVFSGNDDVHGLEPWITDGTPNGTFILKDILQGQASSTAAFYFPKAISLGDNEFLFVATDTINQGQQIWATDGTSSGTLKLLDQGLSWGANDILFYPETVSGKVFFTEALSNDPYRNLWVTDGSSAGTFEIYDSATQILVPYVSSTILNDLFFFYSQSLDNQMELLRSDGTAAGTYKITNAVHAGVGLLNLITYNNKVYFAAYDSLHGNELWSTDGTIAGTSLFKDLIPGTADSRPEDFTIFQNKLFFITNSDSGGYRGALWQSDGTAVGTSEIILTGNLSDDKWLTILGSGGGLLYFDLFKYDSAFNELWRTDGSDTGTWKVATFPNSNFSFNIFGESIDYAGDFYFVASDDDYDYGYSSLWKSDGTAQGTYSIYDNPSAGYLPTISKLKVICDSLFFSVFNENPYPDGAIELWVTDGNNFDHLDFFPYAPEYTGILLHDDGKVFLSVIDTANNYLGYADGLYLFNDCLATDVTEVSSRKNLEVFPNPASDKIRINVPFGISLITIRDILGYTVTHKSIAATNNFSTEEINVSNLVSGIYLITLENGDEKMSAKLVKE